ncbi:MAG: OmpA family protein [Bacteroidota bacterium]
MQRLFLLFFLCLSSSILSAQNDFKRSDFFIDGYTQLISDQCFRLTPDEQWTAGSLWYREAIDLASPFELSLNVMMGCKNDSGADGIVLVFSPRPTRTGWAGEGMGFAGLSPSIGIEIDTWENDHLYDPAQDHIAIMANGNIRHGADLAGPKVVPNLEDCRQHNLSIRWSPTSQKLTVSVDGKSTLTHSGDIVQTIFGGNSTVYWGITAATGRYSNKHEFCIKKIEHSSPMPSYTFDQATFRALMQGNNVTLPGVQFASGSVRLSDEAQADAERLYRFLKKNPKHHVSIDAHTDSSGAAATNKNLSQQRADALKEYLLKKGISKSRIRSNGHGERFPIASNNSSAGRSKNRRVDVFVFIPQV